MSDIGSAGNGLWYTANKTKVKHNPIKIATKQAITVFQSPKIDALPTSML